MSDETLVTFGGAIKRLDDGKIGGYLVRFSTADDPDLEGDYFDAFTDFGIDDGAKSTVWLNHRGPLYTKSGDKYQMKKPIGSGVLRVDEIGVFIEAVLDERERYDELLDKLGWSSGTASHLVDREQIGKAWHITRWPLGLDASLTPTPAEPRTAVIPLKALTLDEPETKAEGELGESKPAETTEILTPVVEQQKKHSQLGDIEMSEQPTFDRDALVNDITASISDNVLKQMQAMLDKQAPAAKGVFSVEEAVEKMEGTKSFGDFLLSVRRGNTKRLAEVYGSTKDMLEQTGAEGGYLVPEEFLAELIAGGGLSSCAEDSR